MNAQVAKLAHSQPHSSDLEFLSVSVDPERDSPDVLAAYAKKFQADPKRWHFTVGPRDIVARMLVDGFKLSDGGAPQFHTTRLILVDREGRIRGYYLANDSDDLKQISEDLNRLH